jgi:hypothetical protein
VVASHPVRRAVAAVLTTALTATGLVMLDAGPAAAGNCSIAGCGVVRNLDVVKPGEVSTKHKRDTDTFALQCTGNYYRFHNDNLQTSAAYRWIHSDGWSARVVNQNC